jgi:hypothetical protein
LVPSENENKAGVFARELNDTGGMRSSPGGRLKQEADSDRARAADLPPGQQRDALLRKARQADTAAHIDEWASSPGLQPPS